MNRASMAARLRRPRLEDSGDEVPANEIPALRELVHFHGAVVRVEHLRSLENVAKNSALLSAHAATNRPLEIRYRAGLVSGETVHFADVNELAIYPNTSPDVIETLTISYRLSRFRGVEIKYLSSGEVKLVVTGRGNAAEELIHRLHAEIKRSDEAFNAAISVLILGRRVRRMLVTASFFAALGAMFSGAVSVYARFVGVDIDPKYVPAGNAYAKVVVSAIESSKIEDKLNVILSGNLRDFENASIFISRYQSLAVLCLIVCCVCASSVWVIGRMRRLYPLMHFSIGHQSAVLDRLKRQREFWMVAVGAGLFINILAGVLLWFAQR